MSIRALKWQDFSDPSAKVVRETKPEQPAPQSIDSQALETMLAKARGKGKADGFAEGVAMAEARAESEMRMVLNTISEKISDLELLQKSVQDQVVSSVQNIATTLFRAIAPTLAESALMHEIKETVADAFSAAPSARIIIVVSPERASRVAELLEQENLSVHVDEDPEIGSLAARVHMQGGFDVIDLNACIERSLEILGKHCAAAAPGSQETPIERRRVNE